MWPAQVNTTAEADMEIESPNSLYGFFPRTKEKRGMLVSRPFNIIVIPDML